MSVGMSIAKTACLVGVFALLLGGLHCPSLAADAAIANGAASSAAQTPQIRLEQYFLLAISPSEGVAVLRGPDRRLVTLRVGSTLATARARLAQVLGDRLRFDAVDDKGVRQTAWMIRSANPEELPEVQRVSSSPPFAPSVNAKSTTTIAPLSAIPSTK